MSIPVAMVGRFPLKDSFLRQFRIMKGGALEANVLIISSFLLRRAALAHFYAKV